MRLVIGGTASFYDYTALLVQIPPQPLTADTLLEYLPWVVAGVLALLAAWLLSLFLLARSYRREHRLAASRLRALQLHEEFHRTVFENAFDGTAVVNPDGTFRFITEASIRVTGRTAAEMTGKLVTETLHPDDVAPSLAILQELAATPGHRKQFVVRTLHLDGQYRYVEINAVNLCDQPAISGILSSFRDVTQAVEAETRLRSSERNYRRLIETTGEGVWVFDVEGATTFVNPRMADMFGYASAEMLGKTLLEFTPLEQRSAATAFLDGRRERISEQYEVPFERRDGAPLLGLLTTNPLHDENGEYLGTLAIVSDITERRRAEDALRANEQRLRQAMEAARMSGWCWDSTHDALTWTEDVEQTVEIPMTRPWDSLEALIESVHRHDQGATRAAFDAAVRRGAVLDHEFRVLGRDRREYWLVARGRLPQESSAGSSPAATGLLFGLMMNIAGRKNVETALKESQARLCEAQHLASLGSWEWYPVMCVGTWSEEMYRLLGFAPGSRTPSWPSLRNCIHPDDVVTLDRALNDVITIGEVLDDRFRIVRPNGDVRVIRLRAKSVDVSRGDRERRIIGTCHDITELTRTESQLRELMQTLERRVAQRTASLVEKNAELESFAYTISHDLRAPLRAMLAFAEAVLEDFAAALPPDGREYLQHIVRAAYRMDQLIIDLLEYSRIVRQELYYTEVSLDDCLKGALETLEPEIQASQADVHIQTPLDRVSAHPSTTERVLANLLSNAIKFVAAGERPRIEIWTERRESGVRLWVVDNGIGIPDDHRDRVFRIFERLHGEESYPGTGVGLAIVARAVDRLGGRCGVEAGSPSGCRFWIELPALEAVMAVAD